MGSESPVNMYSQALLVHEAWHHTQRLNYSQRLLHLFRDKIRALIDVTNSATMRQGNRGAYSKVVNIIKTLFW